MTGRMWRRWWSRAWPQGQGRTGIRGALTLFGAVALATAGCASTMSAGAHVRPDLETARYRTYDWGPADALPAGDPRLDRNGDFQDHLEGAVEKQLAARGLERATTTPDLLLHYHAAIDRRIDVGRSEREYGTCRSAGCSSWVVEYEAGTLVIDAVDARTNELIWRGWAQDGVAPLLASRAVMAQKVGEAVERMMARFPVRRVAGSAR